MGYQTIGEMMGSGKESTMFPRRWSWRGVGGGRVDGVVQFGGLVLRKLVTTEISIVALSPSRIGWKLHKLLLTQ